MLRNRDRAADIHAWRIATRRLLAIEALFAPAQGYPAAQGVERIQAHVGRAFRAAGRVRDMQVSIARLRAFGNTYAVANPVITDLQRRLPRRRRKFLRRLRRIDVKRLRETVRSWGIRADDAAVNATERDRLVRRAATRADRIWARVERARAAIPGRASSRALHQLRIGVKRSRYMMQCLASVRGAAIDPAVLRRLGSLQERLGAIADLEVLDRAVRRFQRKQSGAARTGRSLRRTIVAQKQRRSRAFLRRGAVAR